MNWSCQWKYSRIFINEDDAQNEHLLEMIFHVCDERIQV